MEIKGFLEEALVKASFRAHLAIALINSRLGCILLVNELEKRRDLSGWLRSSFIRQAQDPSHETVRLGA